MRSNVILATALLALPAVAHAAPVPFPSEGSFVPFGCGDDVATDLHQDSPGFDREADIVGDLVDPAAFHAATDDYLFLRIRLDEDLADRPFAWGVEVDLDNDPTDYEVLILVDRITPNANSVLLYRNTTTTTPNTPTDPADAPPIATYPIADNTRSIRAVGSLFGASEDFFLDFAVPWADLTPLGFAPDTPIRVWIASSSLVDALDGDFACHDRATGTPTFGTVGTRPTTGNPDDDPDPIVPPSETRLEGGGGCTTGHSSGLATGLLLAALAMRSRGRARASASSGRASARPR